MVNAVYFQSGGPTAVINSSFYGVIKKYQETNKIDILYGAKFGIQGLLDDDLIKIEKNKDYSFLTKVPGAILGSARIRLGDFNDPIYEKILKTVKKYSIGYIFVNGGNDSMDTADKLNRYFKNINYDCKVMGIAKTIDNDLIGTEFTPGFASAVNYIVKTIMEISLDIKSYKKGRVTIIETMGRDTGWLCASSTLANNFDNLGPDLIYVPEVAFDKQKFLQDVKKVYESKGYALICVSEALKDDKGNYIFCDNNNLDSFGHIQLGSVSKNLCDLVKKELHYNTRNIELNLMQRCASHINSNKDVEWATMCGYKAVEFVEEDNIGMVTINKDQKGDIYYSTTHLSEAANIVKYMPKSFINRDGNHITKEGEEYFSIFLDPSLKIEMLDEFK